jgi:hypothetical protein
MAKPPKELLAEMEGCVSQRVTAAVLRGAIE